MANTKIEWTDKSWNPITGCSHSGSPGCDHCYAKPMAYRLKGRYGYPKDEPFRVTFHPDRLDEPLHWKKPCRIFVCSMGDLFHEDVKFEWIEQIFDVMRAIAIHTFLLLTKRPQRVLEYWKWRQEIWLNNSINSVWPSDVFLGVSIEDQKTADERIPILLQIPTAKRFVSVEPMLNAVNLEDYFYHGKGRYEDTPGGQRYHLWDQTLNWAICGGETGPNARPLHPGWVKSLRDQCQAAGVPFFFKSWGEWLPVGEKPASEFKPIGKNDAIKRFHLWEDLDKNVSIKIGHKAAGRLLDGKIWEEIPK